MEFFFDFFRDNFFNKVVFFLYTLISSWFSNPQAEQIKEFGNPKNEMHQQIIKMDSIYFNAYNNCDISTQRKFLSNDIEFFHDRAGLSTSKTEILSSIKKNICGKVTRILIEDSIETYPIKNYGAVEIGYHKFINNEEPNNQSTPSKFIIIWKEENAKWEMTKIVSLH